MPIEIMKRNVLTLLHKYRFIITAYIINTIVIIVFFNAYLSNETVFLYPLLLASFMLGVALIVSYTNHSKMKTKLDNKDWVEKKYDLYEQDYIQKINETKSELNEVIYTINNKYIEDKRFISMWIHKMKNNINVLKLLSAGDIAVENEINKLDNMLGIGLNFLRSDEFANDFVMEEVNLVDEVRNVINELKENFIKQSCFPKLEVDKNARFIIYTDRKWNRFIIEQIILNAIKYSKRLSESPIEFGINESESGISLIIKDYGIGISEVDLPRVYEAFFTGKNGRDEKAASGIGLYITDKVAKQLNHSIDIESIVGEGTKVMVSYITKM